MTKNVFEVGNLIFVKNAMGARIWNVDHRSDEAVRIGYVRRHFYETMEFLPCHTPVVFFEDCKVDSFGRSFLKILGPNGVCYAKKAAFL